MEVIGCAREDEEAGMKLLGWAVEAVVGAVLNDVAISSAVDGTGIMEALQGSLDFAAGGFSCLNLNSQRLRYPHSFVSQFVAVKFASN